METYQVLGLSGSIVILAVSLLGLLSFQTVYNHMGGMMGYTMMGYPSFWMPWYFMMSLPSFILGIIGSLVSDKTASGVMLIIASILSLPVFFGAFGISFALLIAAGIMAIAKR
jgi:hypothetical protein